jgi:hypothetical protein
MCAGGAYQIEYRPRHQSRCVGDVPDDVAAAESLVSAVDTSARMERVVRHQQDRILPVRLEGRSSRGICLVPILPDIDESSVRVDHAGWSSEQSDTAKHTGSGCQVRLLPHDKCILFTCIYRTCAACTVLRRDSQ